MAFSNRNTIENNQHGKHLTQQGKVLERSQKRFAEGYYQVKLSRQYCFWVQHFSTIFLSLFERKITFILTELSDIDTHRESFEILR